MTPSWRFFPVTVGAVRRLSPSFIRVTFVGDCLKSFADNGYDQRIKLCLPVPAHGFAHLPMHEDWWSSWRALPDDRRNPIRTYTAAAVRPDLAEVDVDMVLHGDGGPASQWALLATVGDELVLLGPNAEHSGDHGGLEFRPPIGARLLIAGDETAVPAVAAILSRLPADARGDVVLEVPALGDALDLPAPTGLRVQWVCRDGAHDYGARLVAAVQHVVAGNRTPVPAGVRAVVDELDPDGDIWEVPEEGAVGDRYAWLAGESAAITTLRRHLVKEQGWDRKSVAFMGYWKNGRAES
ncbi:NADPH-dependent ferric siderophore reductase, contains FAD-binding and SIP domains [Asanoa hainanensis]|uniref:NADPH-dependent ferric siderophore reductase, contains FAD-binding and SIP domains n=1 Tax=Asanoa hainanensis TaxID=560556 RepID=A0A239GAY2_9ACTN|nr:siderophore-interacting protein [Asanoa hainanensis]SNS66327.1 NADPH-dependent ferric siderophore reductase, contains FAD-binding and SIP domains [Asanoa hainanensis]